MAVAQGYGKTVTSGSVFAYDTGDTVNSYRGEPTTNVFVHYGTTGEGSGADNGVTFNVNGTGTFIRLGYGQTFGGYTIKPEDVVYKYDLGAYGCHYHGSDTTIPNGKYATFSFDYYISPGTADLGVGASLLANFENALGGGINLPNTNTGIWQSVSFTSGPTSGGTLRSLLYPGACGPRLASSGYILYKNPQVEYLPHKTPFVQTTRSVTQGLLPLVGNSTIDLTNVSFDSNAQMVFDGTDDCIDLNTNSLITGTNPFTIESITNKTAGSYGAILGNYGPGYGTGLWWATAGLYLGGNLYHTDYSTTMAGWHYSAVTRDSSGNAKLYRDGILVNTATLNASVPANVNWRIGADVNGAGEALAGNIPVVKTYNRVLSDAEIKQNYSKYKSRFNLS